VVVVAVVAEIAVVAAVVTEAAVMTVVTREVDLAGPGTIAGAVYIAASTTAERPLRTRAANVSNEVPGRANAFVLATRMTRHRSGSLRRWR
jgi:hypothetical protein